MTWSKNYIELSLLCCLHRTLPAFPTMPLFALKKYHFSVIRYFCKVSNLLLNGSSKCLLFSSFLKNFTKFKVNSRSQHVYCSCCQGLSVVNLKFYHANNNDNAADNNAEGTVIIIPQSFFFEKTDKLIMHFYI